MLPLEFKLDVFKPKRGAEPDVNQKYYAKVDSIAPTENVSVMPDIPYPIWIDDRRFTDAGTKIDSIGYVVSNKDWPSMENKRLQELFEQKKRSQSINLGVALSEPKIRLLPRIFIGLVLVSFPLIVLMRWIKKGK